MSGVDFDRAGLRYRGHVPREHSVSAEPFSIPKPNKRDWHTYPKPVQVALSYLTATDVFEARLVNKAWSAWGLEVLAGRAERYGGYSSSKCEDPFEERCAQIPRVRAWRSESRYSASAFSAPPELMLFLLPFIAKGRKKFDVEKLLVEFPISYLLEPYFKSDQASVTSRYPSTLEEAVLRCRISFGISHLSLRDRIDLACLAAKNGYKEALILEEWEYDEWIRVWADTPD